MEKIDFDLNKKGIRVQDIFNVSPTTTNYVIIKDYEEVWRGSELTRCKYRECEVSFMRIVGEPYKDGYIEIKI